MIKFPKHFLWGAATSAYQVEGNNVHADWWHWEKRAGKEQSGRACRHYEFYKQDFDFAKGLHHNAHRISIEWSRIEPKEGRFSRKELKHYLDVVLALRKRGLEPVVTLHHFTNPAWFAKAGGWANLKAVLRFHRYVKFMVRALAKHVHYWVTINEPAIYISHAYLLGVWPPQEKSFFKAVAVHENMVWAHVGAYHAIHQIYKELKIKRPSVGIAKNVMAFVPRKRDLKNQFAAYLRNQVYNLGFIDRVLMFKALDFVGVNYYSRQVVDLKAIGFRNLAMDVSDKTHRGVKKNSLGWEIYPKGLYELLLKLKKYHLPVMITENGICTPDDCLRWSFIRSHLKFMHRAMQKGVRVIGYLYWSLMDNFEWDKGFTPRFGLVEIDYKTFKRAVRPSAREFGRVCQTGILK